MVMSMSRYHAECYDHAGYCPHCDDVTTYEVEPDASGYACDACDALSVMGLEEAMFSGYVKVET